MVFVSHESGAGKGVIPDSKLERWRFCRRGRWAASLAEKKHVRWVRGQALFAVRQVSLEVPPWRMHLETGLGWIPWDGFRWPVCIELIEFPFSGDRFHSPSAVPPALTLDPLL